MSIGIRGFPLGNIFVISLLRRGLDFSRNNNNLRIERESKALFKIMIQESFL
jgi:hypothetical protein